MDNTFTWGNTHVYDDHIPDFTRDLVCTWRNCPRAFKPFRNLNMLLQHIKEHEICWYCSQAFSHSENVEDHLMRHINAQQRSRNNNRLSNIQLEMLVAHAPDYPADQGNSTIQPLSPTRLHGSLFPASRQPSRLVMPRPEYNTSDQSMRYSAHYATQATRLNVDTALARPETVTDHTSPSPSPIAKCKLTDSFAYNVGICVLAVIGIMVVFIYFIVDYIVILPSAKRVVPSNATELVLRRIYRPK